MKLLVSGILLLTNLYAAAHDRQQTASSHVMTTSASTTTNRLNHPPLLRGLQPEPPEPPELPEPPDWDGEPASYCDFLFFFFDAQANAYGYDCECETDDEKDTVTCRARNLACDAAYVVGDVEVICHNDHFTASLTRGSVAEEGYKIFDMEACAEYPNAEFAPERLVGSEFCFVYRLSVAWGQGYNLERCGLTWRREGGEPEQVCTCSVCYTTVGILTVWGLGLDCQEALIPGITLAQCQPLTNTNPAVIPLIEEYRQDDTNATELPLPTTDEPPTSTSSVASTSTTTTSLPSTTESTTTPTAATTPSTTTTSTEPTTTTVSPTVTDPSTTTTTTTSTGATVTDQPEVMTTGTPPTDDPLAVTSSVMQVKETTTAAFTTCSMAVLLSNMCLLV